MPKNDSLTYSKLIEACLEELKLKTSAHEAAWGISKADWAIDQDVGLLIFTKRDGVVAKCSAQIIGTYNTEDDTWLWAWDHPSVVPALQKDARKVHAYGKQHDIRPLITRKVDCTESEAWEFVALACHLCEAQGAYRGPAGNALVFMTFGDVELSKPSKKKR